MVAAVLTVAGTLAASAAGWVTVAGLALVLGCLTLIGIIDVHSRR